MAPSIMKIANMFAVQFCMGINSICSHLHFLSLPVSVTLPSNISV